MDAMEPLSAKVEKPYTPDKAGGELRTSVENALIGLFAHYNQLITTAEVNAILTQSGFDQAIPRAVEELDKRLNMPVTPVPKSE